MINNLLSLFHILRWWNLSPEEIVVLQNKKLRNILVSSYKNVPYYREMMINIGYNPCIDYKGPEDLKKLPITTKHNLNNRNILDFISVGIDYSKQFKDSTTGSTGIPLTIYKDKYARSLQIANWLRVLFVNGYRPWHKVMSFSSPERVNEGKSFIQKFHLFRRCSINFLAPVGQMVEQYFKYKPDILYANLSHLVLLADGIKSRTEKNNHLKTIISVGELLHANVKEYLNDVFNNQIIDSYGSVEFGVMAFDTPERDGMHLNEDLIYFEFLDSNDKPVKPGEKGRVVVTDLSNKLMPLIRYDHQDNVIYKYSDPENPNSLRKLIKIIGRDNDILRFKDGSFMMDFNIYGLLKDYNKIKQFRIIQEDLNKVIVILATTNEYYESIKQSLLQCLRIEIPEFVDIEIQIVDLIEPEKNGKVRTLISNLN